MDQSSKNENLTNKIACEVFTNDVMEKKCLQKPKKNNERKY
jgi:hypothetical protein